jgi:hypothetical protein
MMQKALPAICICFCLIGLALAAELNLGPETLTIDTNKKKQKVPDFPHRKHQELDPFKDQCNKCHHATQPGAQPGKCGACHKHAKKKDPDTGAPGFAKTYHKLCGACHMKGMTKPDPKKCRVCHPQKK